MRVSSSASVVHVSTSAPHPRPGPAVPDIAELRVAFDQFLDESADSFVDGGHVPTESVVDEQVEALNAAHELLAGALAALDTHR